MVDFHTENSQSPSEAFDRLTEQVTHVSTDPGVYIMRDPQGKVLYVGKARNLKKRLQSYFQRHRPHDPKTRLLLGKVSDFETIITHTENEALILESNLIKRHRPRYNVVLKDDKRYPSLRLDITEKYPNLSIVRKIKDDGAIYFGPYGSAGAVRQALKFINKTFKLCKCRCEQQKKRTRPCLNYQMGLCMGPCVLEVAPEAYQEAVKEVVAFLRGRTPALIRRLKKQMLAAAANQAFEKAAALRDKMFALEKTLEKQVSVTADHKDRDVFALVEEQQLSAIALLRVRGGFLLGGRNFAFEEAIGTPEEQMGSFLGQYYQTATSVPREILVSHLPMEKDWVEKRLSHSRGGRVIVSAPQRGDKEKLVQMAFQNAGQALIEHRQLKDTRFELLEALGRCMHLKRLPRRIECFDNSNLFGSDPVAAMVVFENGKPLPSAYRRYKIRSGDKPDDYAHMAEVIRRRFEKGEASRPWPDLLLVDGGKGQIGAAQAVLMQLGLADAFDLAGIAKKDPAAGQTQDKIYLPGRTNAVQFGRDQEALLLLQHVRDEAHRCAVTFQRRRRQTSAMQSMLDGIQGVGSKRKALLLKRFGGIEQIRAASLEELQSVEGISMKVAESIKKYLNQVTTFKP